MKGKWLLIIILVVLFSGGRIALADGEHSKDPSTTIQNGQSEHDMEGMTEGEDMEGMNMEGTGGHSHEPVKEKPANLKVLGTFGAVNLSFIVIGVWNKWFRRKDGSNGNS